MYVSFFGCMVSDVIDTQYPKALSEWSIFCDNASVDDKALGRNRTSNFCQCDMNQLQGF